MTKKQKQEKIDVLKSLLLSKGFKLDTYGNYKLSSDMATIRVKIKKINVRIEYKTPSGQWRKISSEPITHLDIENLWLNKYKSIQNDED